MFQYNGPTKIPKSLKPPSGPKIGKFAPAWKFLWSDFIGADLEIFEIFRFSKILEQFYWFSECSPKILDCSARYSTFLEPPDLPSTLLVAALTSLAAEESTSGAA